MAKKTINPSERDFQNWFKSNWSGWLTQLHPGQGSDVGVPDLILGVSSGLLPVEVKIGSVDDQGLVWTCAVRPAQIRWHTNLADHGYNSILLIGCWQGDGWKVIAVDASLSRFWDVCGFKLGETAFELDPSNLFDSLNEFVFRQLEQ
jgi:hypothetical protein